MASRPRTLTLLLGIACLSVLAAPRPAWAQTPEAVLEANRLRDAGRFADAASALASWLEANPDDAGTRWFRAQLLYWAGDSASARAEYERALESAPGNDPLRLDFARFLMDAGRLAEAQRVLAPLTEGNTGVDAEALRATIAYWRDDYPAAITRFRRVLAARPGDSTAIEGLAGIRTATAPWIDVTSSVRDDNQPLRSYSVSGEVGAYPVPLVQTGIRTEAVRFDPGHAGAVETASEARAFAQAFVPGAGVDISIDAGVHRRQLAAVDLAVGRIEAGVHLPRAFTLRAGVARSAYTSTLASIDTSLAVRSVDVRLERASAPGLAGEMLFRRDLFPDGNTIVAASAWFLVPVHRGIRIGYAFGHQDAAESRWTADPLLPGQGRPSADITVVPGRYDPYYTPEEVNAHTGLVEFTWARGKRELRFTTALPLYASERAPVLDRATPATALDFADRRYFPFSATLGARAPVGGRVELNARAIHQRTAYYEITTADVGLRVRLR